MEAEQFETELYKILDGIADGIITDPENEDLNIFNRVTYFHDAGVLTTNKGLVVKTDDGSEFQLVIVKSK